MTKEEQKEYLRKYRIKTGNRATHKYEKTPKGFLMRKYRNMQSRVLGINKRSDRYIGKKLLSRDVFYEWALSHSDFWRLYGIWVANKYDRKLCPTVDRIDNSEGYVLKNMRWLTHSENSRLGSLSKKNKNSDTLN